VKYSLEIPPCPPLKRGAHFFPPLGG
jgi:hypothetical protein